MSEQVVCYWNIGPQERRKRLIGGLASGAIGIIAGIILLAFGVAPLWRLALFLPFVSAGVGYFQSHEKT